MSLSLPPRGKVAVLGAGVSGLSFAYFLNKLRPDLLITIYEKQNRAGGWINTDTITNNVNDTEEKIVLEKGPRTLRGISEGTLLIVDILKQLNCSDQIEVMSKASIANKKYLMSANNELIQVPDDGKALSLLKFLVSDLSSGLVKGILGEPFRGKSSNGVDESIEQFMERRFGSKAITNNIFSAIMHGVYAGDVEKLSASSIIPRLTEIEDKYGSLIKGAFQRSREGKPKEFSPSLLKYEELISPKANFSELSSTLKKFPMLKLHDGLQKLPTVIANYLSLQPNITFKYNTCINLIDMDTATVSCESGVTQYSHVRSTINSHDLSKLLVGPQELKSTLKEVAYVSVFLVNMYSKNIKLIPKAGHGFGFLVPKKINNPECLLGVIYDSDVEQNVEPFESIKDKTEVKSKNYSKVTLMLGGHFYNNSGIPSTRINLKIVRDILETKLGVNLDGVKLIIQEPSDSKTVSVKDDEILISYVLHENCIPQYNTGYQAISNKVKELSNTKLSFGGMAFGKGVGVPDCIQNALEDAIKHK